jgi:cell shape-determining protein MreC
METSAIKNCSLIMDLLLMSIFILLKMTSYQIKLEVHWVNKIKNRKAVRKYVASWLRNIISFTFKNRKNQSNKQFNKKSDILQ